MDLDLPCAALDPCPYLSAPGLPRSILRPSHCFRRRWPYGGPLRFAPRTPEIPTLGSGGALYGRLRGGGQLGDEESGCFINSSCPLCIRGQVFLWTNIHRLAYAPIMPQRAPQLLVPSMPSL